MKANISFSNVLLFLLTIAVLWLVLVNEVNNVGTNGTVYMPNQDGNFAIIKTSYGGFPVRIDETKRVEDGTELSLILINPFHIHFGDAKVSILVNETVETVRMNLVPSVNSAKFKVPPIERGDLLEISLNVDRIYFK